MKEKDEVRYIAELEVNGEIIRAFDRAWGRAMELPRPVLIRLRGFVRKDS